MKIRLVKRVTFALALLLVGLWLWNASFLADPLGNPPVLLAHRGLAQGFTKENLGRDTCTAARMVPHGHDYLENTIRSMRGAFAMGADIVEFDVHPTTDGRFAVFHDWTVDCRTEGSGVTREKSLAELQALDVGYGYTADGGESFPFRGEGVRLMPSLSEVLATFPDGAFVIDIKGNDVGEGVRLAEVLERAGHRGEIMAYGGGRPITELVQRRPRMRTMTRPRLKRCLVRYLAVGWSGYVPDACRNGMVLVPANATPWIWGWPNRFLQRMDAVGSRVFVIGNYGGEGFSQGFDDPARLDEFSGNYGGGIWTDRIDLLGPALKTP